MSRNITCFNKDKEHSFLKYNEIDNLFVHYSTLELEGYKNLSEDEIDLYELLKNERGLQARNVIESKHHL